MDFDSMDIAKEAFTENLIKRIQKIMYKSHITQSQLAASTNINPSTLSKLFSRKSDFTLEQLLKISNYLKVDIGNLLSFESEDVESNQFYSLNIDSDNDNLFSRASRSAFKGYLGNTYHIYFYSTISSEEKILHGIMKLSEVNDRCVVELCLFTGKTDVDGNEVTKNYCGNMVISITMSTCYCILMNQQIGEMCFLAFHHMFLLHNNIECRMAVALTTSSGENRRPTVHRMVICHDELDLDDKSSKDSEFVKGQLKLNSSKIIISAKEFDMLINKPPVTESEELKVFFKQFQEDVNVQKENYYCIDEASLRSYHVQTDVKIRGISLLRNCSVADKYNKISTKSDEFLFKYLESKKRINK